MINYTVAEYTSEDNSVEVTFENEFGLQHKRTINIPKNDDGSIDEEYFQEILDGQLRGVINKIKVGAIQMIDPTEINTETPEDIQTPQEDQNTTAEESV